MQQDIKYWDEAQITTPMFMIKRVIIFLLGLFVLALGAAAMIQANLGVASWDVLHIGLANITPLNIGIWVQLIGALMILLACMLDKQWPQIGSIVNIVVIGFFLNFILDYHLIPVFTTFITKALLLVTGIMLMGFGSGMYVATAIGAGPRDGLTLALAKRSGFSIRLVRTALEVTALLLGWLIGGPIAAGTFISVFLVGPIMQASLLFWRKHINAL